MVESKYAWIEAHDEIPESGESLMMNRVLLKPQKVVQEPSQRRNLCRTMCKIEGKCCKLIIDNESIDNLVSIEMVDKLRLKKIPNPTPCRVSWFQKGHQVLVNEQCQVEFHIGNTMIEFYAM